MFSQSTQSIVIFIVCVIILLILFGTFIITIIYRYKRNQHSYFKELETLEVTQDNALLQAQLDMQEYTFQNISREIHDNIGQKLSLAKLLLNTQTYIDLDVSEAQINDSISMISEAINDLSDISRSMSSEIILNNGLATAIEYEVSQLQKTRKYEITLQTTGSMIFLDGEKELVLFRIVQESLQNIIKHAKASIIAIHLHYGDTEFTLTIQDNGTGFENDKRNKGTGLINIRNRTSTLQGNCFISSNEQGTQLIIKVPI